MYIWIRYKGAEIEKEVHRFLLLGSCLFRVVIFISIIGRDVQCLIKILGEDCQRLISMKLRAKGRLKLKIVYAFFWFILIFDSLIKVLIKIIIITIIIIIIILLIIII